MSTVNFSAALINTYPISSINTYQRDLQALSNVYVDMTPDQKTLYDSQVALIAAAVGYQAEIDVATTSKLALEAVAGTALVAYTAHSALPAYIAADAAEFPTVAQQEVLAAHDALMSAYILQVSNASTKLTIIVEKQALFDAQVLSLNWVPPPSNTVVLDELKTILEIQDAGIATIQQDISTISTASDLYTEFNTKINTYKNFENLVSTQLQQLDLFLKSDDVIDSQEVIISDLYFKTNTAIKDYRDIVSQNNLKTMDVKTSYESVQQRLDRLKNVSVGIKDIMDKTKLLIMDKRSAKIAYNRVVNLPLKAEPVANMARVSLDVSPSKLTTYGFSLVGGTTDEYNLLYDFTWNSTTKMLKWNPSSGSGMQNLIFKFEVLSTLGKPFDTTTIAKARVWFANGNAAYTINTPNFKNLAFSSVLSSTLNGTNINLSPGDSVEIILAEGSATTISTGLISMILL